MVLVSALLAIVVALAQYGARDDFLACARAHLGIPAVERAPVRAGAVQVAAVAGETLAAGILDSRIGPGRRSPSRSFPKPPTRLGRAWEGELGVPSGIFPREHWKFLLPNAGIAAIVGALALRYFHVAHQWRRNIELETRARVRALQAAHPAALPVQQHERHRGADANGSGARRGGDRGSLRPVPVQPRRRAWSDSAARRIRGRAGLSAHRAAAAGRSAAGELADRRHAGTRAGAEPAAAAAARECNRARDRIAARRRYGHRAGAGGR